MVNWENASRDDLKRLRAIEIVLGRYPYLVGQMFSATYPCLRRSAQDLMSGRSRGEKILIGISLDLWNESAATQFLDLDRLDDENLENVFSALKFLRAV